MDKSLADQLFDADFEILQLKERLAQLYPLRAELFLAVNEQNYKNFKWLVVNPMIPQWDEKFEEWFAANTGGGISLDGFWSSDEDNGIPARAAFKLDLKHGSIGSIVEFLNKYVGDIPAHNNVRFDLNINSDALSAVVFHACYFRDEDEYGSTSIYVGFIPSQNKWVVATDERWRYSLAIAEEFASARDALDHVMKEYLTS